MIKRFKKRPGHAEGIQFTGDNAEEILEFCYDATAVNDTIEVNTMEGIKIAKIGEWIVRERRREFTVVEPNIIETDYEEIK
jgi:hypothetical protein